MKLLSVCSARPNFVKLAAVHHAIAESGATEIGHVIVHTGQHYDPLLSDVFFEQLKIPQPDENLGVHGGSREEVIARTQEAIGPVLAKHRPDWVLVYGDVNGALGAAQAAKEAGIRVAHVEAGLRSGDLEMPEEHNRIGIDAIADVLLCSEEAGGRNLQKEGAAGRIELVGNTMIDTLIRNEATVAKLASAVRKTMPDLPDDRFAVATIHRPSNVDDPRTLAGVMEFLQDVAARCPVVLPTHPRLKKALAGIGFAPQEDVPLYLMEPLDYLTFFAFLGKSSFILTDSGGIQEEAVLLQKRCFTLRRNTERPSTIESGSNVLIDPAKEEDRKQVLDFAADPRNPEVTIPELWDGKAGERILDALSAK